MSLNLCCASSSNQFLFQLLSFIFGEVCLHHLGGALHKLLGLHIHNTLPTLTPTTPAVLSTNFLACTYTSPSQHLHQQQYLQTAKTTAVKCQLNMATLTAAIWTLEHRYNSQSDNKSGETFPIHPMSAPGSCLSLALQKYSFYVHTLQHWLLDPGRFQTPNHSFSKKNALAELD